MRDSRHLPADVYGLRTIALLELLKGAAALVAGVMLALHPHASFGRIAERTLHLLHIHRNSDLAIGVVAWARRIDVRDVHLLLLFIVVYVALRLLEGYGLWNARRWAEWIGVINGSLYLPVEVAELIKNPTWIRVGVLLTNIIVVVYLGWELKKGREKPLRNEPEPHQFPLVTGTPK